MQRKFHIIILSILTFVLGCSKNDSVEEISSIYLKQYNIKYIIFIDTTLVYNFNGDRWDDFSLGLTWTFDTLKDPYSVGIGRKMSFKYLNSIDCGMSDLKEFGTQLEWQVGDTVTQDNSDEWWSATTAAESIDSDYNTFQTYMSDLKNKDVYWAYFIESENKIHYGWIRLRCGLFVETAYNLIPEEPIIIGQRY